MIKSVTYLINGSPLVITETHKYILDERYNTKTRGYFFENKLHNKSKPISNQLEIFDNLLEALEAQKEFNHVRVFLEKYRKQFLNEK